MTASSQTQIDPLRECKHVINLYEYILLNGVLQSGDGWFFSVVFLIIHAMPNWIGEM